MVTASRPMRWTATIVAGFAGVLLSGAMSAPALAIGGPVGRAPASPAPNGGAGTGYGPVTNADRDLLVKVRLAGLWEIPAGRMAAEKGASPRVREIGAEIAEQHVELDRQTVEAAKKLNVPIPAKPNSDQQGWLREMQRASGAEFDQIFVDRLRQAHGAVFPAIATVRSGTRNDVVRELASSANDFVLNHLTLLESTGLVDYGSLPLPQGGGAPVVPQSDSALFAGSDARPGIAAVTGMNPTIIWIILAAALAAGGYSMVRLFRTR